MATVYSLLDMAWVKLEKTFTVCPSAFLHEICHYLLAGTGRPSSRLAAVELAATLRPLQSLWGQPARLPAAPLSAASPSCSRCFNVNPLTSGLLCDSAHQTDSLRNVACILDLKPILAEEILPYKHSLGVRSDPVFISGILFCTCSDRFASRRNFSEKHVNCPATPV